MITIIRLELLDTFFNKAICTKVLIIWLQLYRELNRTKCIISAEQGGHNENRASAVFVLLFFCNLHTLSIIKKENITFYGIKIKNNPSWGT